MRYIYSRHESIIGKSASIVTFFILRNLNLCLNNFFVCKKGNQHIFTLEFEIVMRTFDSSLSLNLMGATWISISFLLKCGSTTVTSTTHHCAVTSRCCSSFSLLKMFVVKVILTGNAKRSTSVSFLIGFCRFEATY